MVACIENEFELGPSSVAWGMIGGLRVVEPQAARRVSD
jgi:hypothetical protein